MSKEQIEAAAKEAADNYYLKNCKIFKDTHSVSGVSIASFLSGAEYQAKLSGWVPYEQMKDKLENHKDYLLMFDNGDIYRYSEDFPFAEITHVMEIPPLPSL